MARPPAEDRGPLRSLALLVALGAGQLRRRTVSRVGRAAHALLDHQRGRALLNGLGPCLRIGLVMPFSKKLGASAEPAHRGMAALLDAAIAARDNVGAFELALTAARRPDLGAEKIVSHRYRFLWMGNPKVASTSLVSALVAADPDAVVLREQTLAEVLARHPEAMSYFSFAFMRHPLARVRSLYADKHARARRHGDDIRFIRYHHGLHVGMTFAELCRWLDTPCGADAFADRHWLSQWRHITDAQGRLPDFVGRYERLDEDWRTLAARLGLPPSGLPHCNAGEPDFLRRAVVDARLEALVRRRYARDYQIGGYGDMP